MADEKLCPKCHQPVSATAAFCGNCGNPLQVTVPAEAPANQAVPGVVAETKVKGLKPAAWINIVILSILLMSGMMMVFNPESIRDIMREGGEVYNSADVRAGGLLLLGASLPPVLMSIGLLLSKSPRAKKYLLIGVIVFDLIIVATSLIAGNNVSILLLIAVGFAIRALVALRKQQAVT